MEKKLEWLIECRKEKNLSQEELAEITKISRTTITKIENGDRIPSVNNAKKIAAALEFDWTKFFLDKK